MFRVQYLSKRDIKNIIEALQKRSDIDPSFIQFLKEHEDDVKKVFDEKFEIIVFGAIPALFKTAKIDFYIPTLYILNVLYNTKRVIATPAVTVDEGAIPHLKNGADVMIPGIRKIVKNFSKNDVVAVFEPSEKYFVVVGIALVDSSSILPGVKGKAVKNISHIDDEIWRASLQVAKVFSR